MSWRYSKSNPPSTANFLGSWTTFEASSGEYPTKYCLLFIRLTLTYIQIAPFLLSGVPVACLRLSLEGRRKGHQIGRGLEELRTTSLDQDVPLFSLFGDLIASDSSGSLWDRPYTAAGTWPCADGCFRCVDDVEPVFHCRTTPDHFRKEDFVRGFRDGCFS